MQQATVFLQKAAINFAMVESGSLPFDCCQHIFSYVELVDCLRFASTSSTAMREVLPAIFVRRYRLVKPYAIVFKKDSLPPFSEFRHFGLLDDHRCVSENEHVVYAFPTLHQRISQLAAKIPQAHPLCLLVKKLNTALSDCKQVSSMQSDDGLLSRKSLIESLRQTVLPLKLHSIILKHALLSKHGDDVTTAELQYYIGDVLCVAYLFYDFGSTAQYAEGSISPQCLEKRLCRSPPTCYQSWVLMHACILRTKHFTGQQLSRMGLGGYYLESTLTKPVTNDSDPMISTFLQHSGQFGWNMAINRVRTDHFMKSEMCLVYDDFGPLGPSFRGRDIVRVRDVTADAIQECLIYDDMQNGGGNSRDAIEWICLAHEQTHQSRPMSVRQPVVRFG
jgi:hypothetical protein